MARKRKKKLRRKKEERRETGEREREKRKCFFNERREKSVIKKNIYIYIYILTSSYNTQQKIDMYCSSKVKIFSHAFIIVEQFFFILVKLK